MRPLHMISENCWIWEKECLDTVHEDYFGFIYLIRNQLDGRIYVGKKQFAFKRKVAIAKKNQVGNKKKEIKYVDSGWKKYWGSCKLLQEDLKALGEENFTREILYFARNKAELTYYELLYQLTHEVLLKPSYNGWISARVYKKNLNYE